MAAKVRQMIGWARAHPRASARIFSATEAGTLARVLIDPDAQAGTLIRADAEARHG